MNLLIVDDNEEILEYLTSALEQKGFRVEVARDGGEGGEKASSNDYDLIMLDLTLPKKDGSHICFELRKKGINVPVLMLSGNSEIGTKVNLLNIGADDYLVKPFSFDELYARIKALLRRPAKLEPSILEIGNLTLNKDSRVVKQGQKEIVLTLKEFDLLEFLIRNKGKVLSRSDIIKHVWDVNADPFTNTIEAHIYSLRKKIENGKKLIHTVARFGYKIE